MAIQIVITLVALVLVAGSVRAVRETERLAILRLGRFVGLRGPGVVWTFPFVDKAIRVDLDREVPRWRSLSDEELRQEVERWLQGAGLEG
jgi:regulator of protease activity HflC (stomatin/prohibitin superfamily)